MFVKCYLLTLDCDAISIVCSFLWLCVFLTECFEMTGWPSDEIKNEVYIILWPSRRSFILENSTRMWECTVLLRLGRKYCCIRLNPNAFTVIYYILIVIHILSVMGTQWNILYKEFPFVSLHNVHLSFFHCKWMCTMAVLYIYKTYVNKVFMVSRDHMWMAQLHKSYLR